MSTQAVADLLHQALTDPEFLHRFLFSPDAALSAFSLTSFEQAVLTARTPEDLLGLAVRGGEMISCSPNTCQVTCTCTLTCSGDLTALNDGAVTEKPATGIQQVIDKARQDPSFFGTLRTDPDTALSGLALTPAERAAISANTPEKLLSLVIGTPVAGAGCDQTCGYTCANTCSGGYTMSCGSTCSYTCDYTAGIQLWVGNRPT